MKTILLVLMFPSVCGANPIDDQCPQHVVWGAPQIAIEGDNQYLCRLGYAINYNYKTKVSYFAVESINKDHLSGTEHRLNNFREDSQIPFNHASTLKDYDQSGYDRGHMAPAGDFVYSHQVMSESFLLSNMMPQIPDNNRVGWKDLEEYIRKLAQKYNKLYVVTGTIFDSTKTIGNGVHVPTEIYKIVVDPQRHKAIAFLVPNEKMSKVLGDYVVSISKISEKTHINYFPKNTDQTLLTQPGSLKDW